MRTLLCSALVIACGTSQPPTSAAPTPPTSSPPIPIPTPIPSPSPIPAATKTDSRAIYTQLEPALLSCYETGRKSTPTMLDGKLTLNAAIEDGKATCSIPTEDTGLTQEVEDCMSAKLAAHSFDRGPPSALSIPVQVKAGKLAMGEPTKSFEIESIETHRMSDAFDVLEQITPELQACIRGMDKSSGIRSVLVGARVATTGKPQCALSTSAQAVVPAKVAECTSSILKNAKFPPPKGGPGLILVPLVVR